MVDTTCRFIAPLVLKISLGTLPVWGYWKISNISYILKHWLLWWVLSIPLLCYTVSLKVPQLFHQTFLCQHALHAWSAVRASPYPIENPLWYVDWSLKVSYPTQGHCGLIGRCLLQPSGCEGSSQRRQAGAVPLSDDGNVNLANRNQRQDQDRGEKVCMCQLTWCNCGLVGSG